MQDKNAAEDVNKLEEQRRTIDEVFDDVKDLENIEMSEVDE